MDPSALRSHGQNLPEEALPEGKSPEQVSPERRLPDSCDASAQDRRRNLRQRLHSPVYVSFDGPDSGFAVELSELLDLHEEGFAVQAAEPLEVNRTVTLCLDLPETQSYIHGSGEVIWSDQSGRGGIRFRALSDHSRQALRKWLFANLLIGSNNLASQAEHRARHEEEEIIGLVPVAESEPETGPEPSSVAAMPPRSEAFSVESVGPEIRALGDDVDAVLQALAERAQNLTGASGAALAFVKGFSTHPSSCLSPDEQMLCRARCGDPAPPLGSPVEIRHGLSGECVRTGQLVSCDDMANDPRVDPEVGRALGIGSLIAVPIVSDFRVVGLLEVFSPHPNAFAAAHAAILERLVEMIPNTCRQMTNPEATPPRDPRNAEPRTPVQTPSVAAALKSPPLTSTPRSNPRPIPLAESDLDDRAETRDAPPRLVYRVLLGLVTVVVATVLGYLVGPIIGKRWLLAPQAAQQTSAEVVEAASSSSGQRPQAASLAGLRQLANQGDADAEWQMGIRCHDAYPPDDAQAMQWFERAANQGYVAAQATLGAYYWAGRGVPSDLSKAYMWSAIAFAGGDQNSKIRLEGLASQMTRAQISVARQQAEAWIHQHTAKSESN